MGISNADYVAMLSRTQKVRPSEHKPHEGLESELHDKIINFCKSKGWIPIHSRMDVAQTSNLGTADFIIAAGNGVTYWIEAKRKNGKPTKEQVAMNAWLKKLGHKAAIVYSMEEFLETIK